MLVLSRKKNESIVIDDRISVMVVEVVGGKVRLGIDAPRNVTVHRQEVFDAIQRDRLQGGDGVGRGAETNQRAGLPVAAAPIDCLTSAAALS